MLSRWASAATIVGVLFTILMYFYPKLQSNELIMSIDDVRIYENEINVSVTLVNKTYEDEVLTLIELSHVSEIYPVSFREGKERGDFPLIIRSNEIKKLSLKGSLDSITLDKASVSFLILVSSGSFDGIKKFNFGCLDINDKEFHFSLMVFDIHDDDGDMEINCAIENYSSYYKLQGV
ncbi:TPA: hypothetical protein NK235_004634 [Vibrio parahaemolyticus]|nr:hypothetical protein [Vibrio parahaemolyticus]